VVIVLTLKSNIVLAGTIKLAVLAATVLVPNATKCGVLYVEMLMRLAVTAVFVLTAPVDIVVHFVEPVEL